MRLASARTPCAQARRFSTSPDPAAASAPFDALPPQLATMASAALRAALRAFAAAARSSNQCFCSLVCGTTGLILVACWVAGSLATNVNKAVMLGWSRCACCNVRRTSIEELPVKTTCPAAHHTGRCAIAMKACSRNAGGVHTFHDRDVYPSFTCVQSPFLTRFKASAPSTQGAVNLQQEQNQSHRISMPGRYSSITVAGPVAPAQWPPQNNGRHIIGPA